MKSVYKFFLLSFFTFFMFGIQECYARWEKEWCRIKDDSLLVWANNIDGVLSFKWSGGRFDKLVHGDGVLSIYKGSSLIKKEEMSAYYGAIADKDVKKVGTGNFYVGETKDGYFNGFGIYVRGNEIQIGNFTRSLLNGKGFHYINGSLRYRGDFSNGKYHGFGSRYVDGKTEQGRWENGKLVEADNLEVTLNDGSVYRGGVVYDKASGQGEIVYKDGSRYKGGWKDSCWHGEGVYLALGDSIYGYWENGLLNGDVYCKNKNYTYVGEVYNGLPDGIGRLLTSDGSYYNGQWVEGKRCGIGNLILSSHNEDTYSGEWLDDEFHGVGKYVFGASGAYYDGEWQKGLQHGSGRYVCEEYEYVGDWKEGLMSGQGVITYTNKQDVYEGDFLENKRHGIGVYYFGESGNIYDGEFYDDKIHGLGSLYFEDGSVYDGEFEDGKIKGEGTLYLVENNDTIVITANWDGSTNFPQYASILFSDGRCYEGELDNGYPTENGNWYSITINKETEEYNSPLWLKDGHEWYKNNKETWDKIVFRTSIVLSVAELIPVPCISVPAKVMNFAINAVDAGVSFTSTQMDIMEAESRGEDASSLKKERNKGLMINGAFIVGPKIIKGVAKRIPPSVRKPVIDLVAKGKNLGKGIGNKVVEVFTDATGKLSKKLHSTSAYKRLSESRIYRAYGRARYGGIKTQAVTNKQYKSFKKKNPAINAPIDEAKDAKKLGDNMKKVGGNKQRKAAIKEYSHSKKVNGPNKRCVAEAHHVVAGNSPAAEKSREILAKTGVGINDPRNGVWLPTSNKSIFKGVKHGRHTKDYDEEVYRRLKEAVDKFGYDEDKIMDVLDDIKKELLNGDLELLRNESFTNTFLNAIF